MPLVGEQAGRGWAYNFGDDLYTLTWDLDFEPSAAFIKLFLEDFFEYSDESGMELGLLNIRFRDQNGADQTVSFPDIDVFDHVSGWFNPTMTHVTFGLRVKATYAAVVWTLGFWA